MEREGAWHPIGCLQYLACFLSACALAVCLGWVPISAAAGAAPPGYGQIVFRSTRSQCKSLKGNTHTHSHTDTHTHNAIVFCVCVCVCSPLSAICQLNASKNSFLNAFPLRCAEREIVHKKKRDREGGRKRGSGTARIVMTNVFNYFRLVFNWPQNAARCNSKAFALGLVTHYFHYAAPPLPPSPACFPVILLIPCGPSTRARTASGSVQEMEIVGTRADPNPLG